ncbi:MAG: hypothetical protein QOF01_1889 [Thermomicrobiales bacterium]|jgi:quercetin dioxygenase-like cupin family protein|nr:hypothetical protein [Thermomicrobiales bacterium]
MRRLISSLVGLLVLLGGGSVSLARQATPEATEISPGITASQLAVADVDALPSDSRLVLFARYTLAPGAEIPPSAGQSVGLFYVESGEVTVTGAGAVSIIRSGQSDLETKEPGDEAILAAGDALSTGVCAESGLRNDGSAPVTLLTGAVAGLTTGQCPGATPAATGANNPGLTPEFLAIGAVAPLPVLPAQLAMAKLTYAPGATDPQPSANAGTVLARVESGTFGITIESGEGTIIRKPATPNAFFSAQQDPLIPGVEATLNPGDFVYEVGGTASQARNIGAEPATVVILTLASAAEPATPTS